MVGARFDMYIHVMMCIGGQRQQAAPGASCAGDGCIQHITLATQSRTQWAYVFLHTTRCSLYMTHASPARSTRTSVEESEGHATLCQLSQRKDRSHVNPLGDSWRYTCVRPTQRRCHQSPHVSHEIIAASAGCACWQTQNASAPPRAPGRALAAGPCSTSCSACGITPCRCLLSLPRPDVGDVPICAASSGSSLVLGSFAHLSCCSPSQQMQHVSRSRLR